MHILTVAEVRAADARAAEHYGIAGQLLMEHAGLHVAKHVFRRLADPAKARVVVFAGKGNNGGDGFVAARHLRGWGVHVRVYVAGEGPKDESDAERARAAAVRCGVDVVPWTEGASRRAALHVAAADVVVDALLGTGASGPPREDVARIISLLNGARGPVVSVDIPSGVDADTGGVPAEAVAADETVTFGALKPGLVLSPGREFAGRITVADIGWPPGMLEGATHTLVTADVIRRIWPARQPDGHKGTFGRILIVAGRRGMAGAAALCVRGAQRIGGGLVTLASPAGLNAVYAGTVPEALTLPLEEDDAGGAAPSAEAAVRRALGRADVVAIGPGLGTGKGTRRIVRAVLQQARVPVVLDADGLNAVVDAPELLENPNRGFPLVVTPHPGEMARLVGVDTRSVRARVMTLARERAARWGAVVVLKGAPTVIAEPNGHVYVNGSGTDALASGGTGDVLTGAIAGLIGQGASPVDAAVGAVYVHGLAGSLAAAAQQARFASGALSADLDGPVVNVGAVAADVADALPAAVAWTERGGPDPASERAIPRMRRIFE